MARKTKQSKVKELTIITVKEIFEKKRKITRNEALSFGITRLGAIIDSLKNQGWIISGEWADKEHSDYVYKLIERGKFLNRKDVEIRFISIDYPNILTLEEYITDKANEISTRGKRAVVLNIFEPVLDMTARLFDMPKRNVVLLSAEKHGYINKVSFNVMDVFNNTKGLFYPKKVYLKNRIKRIIDKKIIQEQNENLVFLIYGFNEKSEKDKALYNYVSKEIKGG